MLGFLCVVFSNLAAIASPWLLKSAIDSLGQSISPQKLLGYGALIVFFAVLSAVFLFLIITIIIIIVR